MKQINLSHYNLGEIPSAGEGEFYCEQVEATMPKDFHSTTDLTQLTWYYWCPVVSISTDRILILTMNSRGPGRQCLPIKCRCALLKSDISEMVGR